MIKPLFWFLEEHVEKDWAWITWIGLSCIIANIKVIPENYLDYLDTNVLIRR